MDEEDADYIFEMFAEYATWVVFPPQSPRPAIPNEVPMWMDDEYYTPWPICEPRYGNNLPSDVFYNRDKDN